MKVYLKIKIKSLALEAETIRREEKKYKTKYEYQNAINNALAENGNEAEITDRADAILHTRITLHEHRVNHVRKEARAALLAYGFLNGRAYTEIEGYTRTGFSWKRVEELVKKYGEGDQRTLLQQFAEWRDNAQDHIDLMILAESAPEVQDDLKVD